MDNVEKLVREGKVAVVYSPGYGAGWSSWNAKIAESLMFDKKIAIAVLDGDYKKVKQIALDIDPNAYLSEAAIEDLRVAWLEIGEKFFIKEYDGWETIVLMKNFKTFEA